MSELRWDPFKQNWTIVTADADRRRNEFLLDSPRPHSSFCPLCEGHEGKCPNELYASRPPGSQPNGPGWRVRVIPNRHPALRVEEEMKRHASGIYDRMNGIGAHEIVIETPSHDLGLTDFSVDQTAEVLRAWRARLFDLRRDWRLRYLLLFKNHGPEAGATTTHSHSQLMALPAIPAALDTELSACRDYFRRKERCLQCDVIDQERADGSRLISDGGRFLCYAPYASSLPFELRITPRLHGHDFALLGDEELADLAGTLREILRRLRVTLRDPSYNIVLHTAPPPHPRPGRPGDWNSLEFDFHWHLEIAPRLLRPTGFHWGTGQYLNPVPPEEAAAFLRQAAISGRP